MAFSVLSLSAKKEWNADNVPIPFLQDSTQYVSDPDGYVDRALKDSANFYLQKLKLECGVQNVLIIVGRVANQDAFRMAQDVGNKYGIGYKKSRRGLVIVIAVEDHKYFIAPGSGLEGELTDVDCDDIARACIVKYMREDAPGEAVASVSRAIYNKVKATLSGLWQGVISLKGVRNVPLYIAFTLGIWLSYFLHYYLTFQCFESTSHLNLMCGLVTFIVGSIAVIVPTPNGAGPWHFAVKTMLILYGIQQNDALYFVLIVHSVQTLLVILLGIYGWIALAFTKKHQIQK